MFVIFDGRNHFYQWDLNQKLIVADKSIKEVHFANCLCKDAAVVETYTDGNLTVANVPNYLLQEYLDLIVYGYDGNSTKQMAVFEITRRPKPADYVYTETEVKDYDTLVAELEAVKSVLVEFDERLTALENANNEIKFYIEGEEFRVMKGTTWDKAINSKVFGTAHTCPSCGDSHYGIEADEFNDYVVRLAFYGDYCMTCQPEDAEMIYLTNITSGEKVLGTDTIIANEYYELAAE